MRILAAFALLAMSSVPANAQFGGAGGMGGRPASPAQTVETDILEMEQEADKTALKQALLTQARLGLDPAPATDAEKEQLLKKIDALREFITRKKEAITTRAAKIAEQRTAVRRPSPAARAAQPPEGEDGRDAVETYAKSRIEADLIEARVNLLQPQLTKAIQALAAAEQTAGDDNERKEKTEAARKEFEEIKARVVELNTRLYRHRQTMQPMMLQMQGMGMGGTGGGGFR